MTPTSSDFEEPEDVALRERLGLRPVWYANDCKETHPDTRPCPSWCWQASSPESETHEVTADHVAAASHALEPAPSILASLYESDLERQEPHGVAAAQIETHLVQLGGDEPQITVYLRDYPDRKRRFEERLRLTVADAREVITALSYVCEVAERDAPAGERNTFEIGRDVDRAA
ncbi:MAG: hypothetical protein ABI873_01080 [Marmoricola sp.]